MGDAPGRRDAAAAQARDVLRCRAGRGGEGLAVLRQLCLVHGEGPQRWPRAHGCQPDAGCTLAGHENDDGAENDTTSAEPLRLGLEDTVNQGSGWAHAERQQLTWTLRSACVVHQSCMGSSALTAPPA